MKNIINMIFLSMAVIFVQLGAHEHSVLTHATRTSERCEKCSLQEFTCIVSPQDLLFDYENILISIDGVLLPVESLEKHNNQWRAKIDFGKNVGYCQRGHDLCAKCELCHLSGCYYYVEPCWRNK